MTAKQLFIGLAVAVVAALCIHWLAQKSRKGTPGEVVHNNDDNPQMI